MQSVEGVVCKEVEKCRACRECRECNEASECKGRKTYRKNI